MRFGICAALDKAAQIKSAGWDFVEENVQSLLQGLTPDAQWNALPAIKASPLPIEAANCLVPGAMKITGPDVDLAQLQDYMRVVVRRARQAGIDTLVFGSGGARQVPQGFDRDHAVAQIIAFGKISAEIAAAHNVTLVIEHLTRSECNIVNSLPEAMRIVAAVNHPSFQCLVDSYHFWMENEALEHLLAAAPFIHHVHLADKDGRVAPGQSAAADYRPLFRILKHAGYDGRMSVEAIGFTNITEIGPNVLEFVKKQWKEA